MGVTGSLESAAAVVNPFGSGYLVVNLYVILISSMTLRVSVSRKAAAFIWPVQFLTNGFGLDLRVVHITISSANKMSM